jgi:hypothetical protein
MQMFILFYSSYDRRSDIRELNRIAGQRRDRKIQTDERKILHLSQELQLWCDCARVFNNQPLLLRVGLVGCQALIQSLMSLHKQPINL